MSQSMPGGAGSDRTSSGSSRMSIVSSDGETC